MKDKGVFRQVPNENEGTLFWSMVVGAYYAVYKSNGERKVADFAGTTKETSFKVSAKGTCCVTAVDKVNAKSKILKLATN